MTCRTRQQGTWVNLSAKVDLDLCALNCYTERALLVITCSHIAVLCTTSGRTAERDQRLHHGRLEKHGVDGTHFQEWNGCMHARVHASETLFIVTGFQSPRQCIVVVTPLERGTTSTSGPEIQHAGTDRHRGQKSCVT
jgi:hypothetical protein